MKMSDRENRIRATGFSKITDVPGKDYPAAILFLQNVGKMRTEMFMPNG